MIELKKGVRLHVIATKKYKTIQIYGRFTTRLTKEIMTKRALLRTCWRPILCAIQIKPN